MKKYLLLFGFGFCLIILSCTKNNDSTPAPASVFDAAQFFKDEVFQTVVFHYNYQNEMTKEYRGWFIDKFGNVKSYNNQPLEQIQDLPQGELCDFSQITNLYGLASTTHTELDLNDLYSKFKLIDVAFHGDVLDNSNGILEDGQESFIAFRAEGGQNMYGVNIGYSGSCTELEYPHDELVSSCNSFEILKLEMNGFENKINESTAAKTIVTWMKEIQEQQNL